MRVGEWFETQSGRRFWPLDPFHAEIDFTDVIQSLARICRFNGHIRLVEHYSVAEHLVLGFDWLKAHANQFDNLDLGKLWLVHDMPEFALGDMIRPLKRRMPAMYHEAEAANEAAFLWRLGLPLHHAEYGLGALPWLRNIDDRLLATERVQVKSKSALPWTDSAEPLHDVTCQGWSPARAADELFVRFNEVFSYASLQALR